MSEETLKLVINPKPLSFGEEKISDQKRLVRGEQLLFARRCLRIRDGVHHHSWRTLILPGGAPREEVGAIKNLMPKSYVVAVDREEVPLQRAIECGVDKVIQVDLADFQIDTNSVRKPPNELLKEGDFDLLVLDLCSGANEVTKRIATTYAGIVAPYGVMILNFSYGRDVAEIYEYLASKLERDAGDYKGASWSEVGTAKLLDLLNMSGNRQLAGRIAYIFPRGLASNIASVMLYKGAQTPMCSVLLWMRGDRRDKPSFTKVGAGDFELAVTCPDPSMMYATPEERISALRRKHAAIKASYTRSLAG